jgi:hypothetical protein
MENSPESSRFPRGEGFPEASPFQFQLHPTVPTQATHPTPGLGFRPFRWLKTIVLQCFKRLSEMESLEIRFFICLRPCVEETRGGVTG